MAPYHVIGISCSPHSGGNTDIMMLRALDAAAEKGLAVELVRAFDQDISPCDACWTCKESGACHIADDMRQIYPKLLKADGIIIGSPVHMGHNVSGTAQVFLDRTFPFWHQKRLKDKVAGGVTVSNRRGAISAIRAIQDVFIDQQMIIAGYATGYAFAPGDIRKDIRALEESENLGRRLFELMQLIEN